LHRLSQSAGLPKERAVLSFLFAGPAPSQSPLTASPPQLRVISDAFPLPPNRFARYCCSPQGLILLTGEKTPITQTPSGALINAIAKKDKKDAKSGALIAELVPPHTK
jgi:hypothetical protein